MIPRNAFEQWETELEVTPQVPWTIAKSLLERDKLKTPTEILGPSGLKFHPPEKVKANTDCLENRSTLQPVLRTTAGGAFSNPFTFFQFLSFKNRNVTE